jgi:hypothetical protein
VTPGQNVLLLQAGQGRELLERAGISTSDGDAGRKGRPKDKKDPAEATAVAGAASAAATPAEAAAASGKKSRGKAVDQPAAATPPGTGKPAASARIEPAA